MRKIILLHFLTIVSTICLAQSNVIVFSDNEEPFLLVVNGVQQNPSHETNVRLTGLNTGAYKLKVLFRNTNIKPIDKTIYIDTPMEWTMAIKKNKKGIYALRLMSQVPINQAPPCPARQRVYSYSSKPRTTVVRETTTTTVNTAPQNDNVNVSVNVGGVGVNMNMGSSVYGSHSTTTQTSTTTVERGNPDYHNHQNQVVESERPVYHHDSEQIYVLPGYSGAMGCDRPMSNSDFESAINSIKNQTFEDSKMTVAKQITASKCLLTSQVKKIMELFTFESNKLDFAKYAYEYTFDVDNYFKVNDAFTYSSSIDELDQYLKSRNR